MSEMLWALFLLLFVLGFQSTWLPFSEGSSQPGDRPNEGERTTKRSRRSQPSHFYYRSAEVVLLP